MRMFVFVLVPVFSFGCSDVDTPFPFLDLDAGHTVVRGDARIDPSNAARQCGAGPRTPVGDFLVPNACLGIPCAEICAAACGDDTRHSCNWETGPPHTIRCFDCYPPD